MSEMNFQTQNEQFRGLIGNGISYNIPPFQRDYSWGVQEWEDLWLDILETIREGGESAHYMGYLVLQSTGEQTRNVIDGQQRLTTLSLIVLAALKNLQRLVDAGVEPENNRLRMEQIRQTYIGYVDPVTLTTHSKLTLNRNNDNYYQTYIVELRALPQRGFNASEMALRRAFEWFDGKLGEHIRNKMNQGPELASFVERMSIRLFFTVITVTDELNAYKVFETLNARGVQLSATDLLKNYLFSVLHREKVHERELDRLDERWAAIIDRLGSERFPAYLRVHWNSRNRTRVRETDLFKTIQRVVTGRVEVASLLNELEEDLETYLALTTGDASGFSPSARTSIQELTLFKVRQPFSLLLAAKRTLPDADFADLLRACVIVSFRYNIIGSLATGDQETAYSLVIRRLIDGEITRGSQAIAGLTSVYPDDDAFRVTFADKSIRTGQGGNRKMVRYVLAKIEGQVSGRALDADDDRWSVEHVLPQHPTTGWVMFDDRTFDQYVYRLGNMIPMETGRNRDMGDAEYDIKRGAHLTSSFGMTRHLAETYEEWTPSRIDQFQSWMANQAVAIWRISQLSDGRAG